MADRDRERDRGQDDLQSRRVVALQRAQAAHGAATRPHAHWSRRLMAARQAGDAERERDVLDHAHGSDAERRATVLPVAAAYATARGQPVPAEVLAEIRRYLEEDYL